MYDQILVPVDGNPPSITALEHAADIAANTNAGLHLVNVTMGADPDTDARAAETVDDAVAQIEHTGVECTTEIRTGEPGEEIVDAAQETGVEAIILGSLGRRGVRRLQRYRGESPWL